MKYGGGDMEYRGEIQNIEGGYGIQGKDMEYRGGDMREGEGIINMNHVSRYIFIHLTYPTQLTSLT